MVKGGYSVIVNMSTVLFPFLTGQSSIVHFVFVMVEWWGTTASLGYSTQPLLLLDSTYLHIMSCYNFLLYQYAPLCSLHKISTCHILLLFCHFTYQTAEVLVEDQLHPP